MESLILKFLTKNWNQDLVKKIQYSAVPKGQSGDLALSFFSLAKEQKRSPHEVAQEVDQVLQKCEIIEKTAIVGPYLNLFFDKHTFFRQVFHIKTSTSFCDGKKLLVEFSSPNTNKPLHLGHMRNHALGIAVSHIFEQTGAEVKKVSIFNDRGVHICKSMLAYQKWGQEATPESTGTKGDHLVGDFYVKFDQESKQDPSLHEEVQAMLVDWESGKKDVKRLWKQMNDWAFQGYHQTYLRQGVSFDKVYYESDLYKAGKEYVLEGLKKGVLKQKDEAIIIDLSEEGLDEKVLLRSNRTTVYMTQDIATTVLKQKDFQPDQQIWIVASEQDYHFKVLFRCLEKLGLLQADHLHHLSYGLVNLPEGRMKSREGTVVDADDLMDELSSLALKTLQTRNPDIPLAEARIISEQIMNAAWKFYLLSTSPRKMMTFDPQQSIAFEGATGPYLQYAGVRLKSIFRKALVDISSPLQKTEEVSQTVLGDPEKPLGIKILEYPQILNRAAETKNPTYLATYLLELTQTWSSYYAEHSVLNAETEALKCARLKLARKVYEILEAGLRVLGIEVPERM